MRYFVTVYDLSWYVIIAIYSARLDNTAYNVKANLVKCHDTILYSSNLLEDLNDFRLKMMVKEIDLDTLDKIPSISLSTQTPNYNVGSRTLKYLSTKLTIALMSDFLPSKASYNEEVGFCFWDC